MAVPFQNIQKVTEGWPADPNLKLAHSEGFDLTLCPCILSSLDINSLFFFFQGICNWLNFTEVSDTMCIELHFENFICNGISL